MQLVLPEQPRAAYPTNLRGHHIRALAALQRVSFHNQRELARETTGAWVIRPGPCGSLAPVRSERDIALVLIGTSVAGPKLSGVQLGLREAIVVRPRRLDRLGSLRIRRLLLRFLAIKPLADS